MFNLDDNQFEAYLKDFKPVAPQALPKAAYGRHRSIGSVGFRSSIAASAVILITGIVIWHAHTRHRGVDRRILEPVAVRSNRPLPPLTVGSANRCLAAASSIEAALDDLAFPARNAPIPANQKSAIAVLGEENATL